MDLPLCKFTDIVQRVNTDKIASYSIDVGTEKIVNIPNNEKNSPLDDHHVLAAPALKHPERLGFLTPENTRNRSQKDSLW